MRLKILLMLPLVAFTWLADLAAQDLSEARRLAESGRYTEAEKIYNEVLAKNPDHLEALIGAGYNLSWAGRYAAARDKFEAALAIDAENKSALIGKGYNLAWDKQYDLARTSFQSLEQLDPGSLEARKGLAYVSLWQGNGSAAIRHFENLVLEHPKDIEYYVALAQAYILDRQVRKARIALRSALLIDSTDQVARNLLETTYGIASPVELDIWSGYSKTDGMGRFNLRTVQLTAQLAPKLRMYLKYDNSLSLDLAALVRSNQDAQAFSVGAVLPFTQQLVSRFEYGGRFLPGNISQQVFSTEQVYFLSDKVSLKAGGFLGISSKIPNEWLAYGSVRLPLSKIYAIEPYYFFSMVEGAPRAENRFMLNNQFRSERGYELNLGALYGISAVPDVAETDKVFGGYATAIFPFSRTVWGQASVRWEHAPFEDLLALGLGLKLRLER